MLFDQAVEQRFVSGTSDLLETQRCQRPQVTMNRASIDVGHAGNGALRRRLAWPPVRGRQLDQAGAVQHQQESAAHHVARLPVALPPVPCLTELVRQSAAAQGRMVRDELADELHVGIRDHATTIACYFAHGLQT